MFASSSSSSSSSSLVRFRSELPVLRTRNRSRYAVQPKQTRRTRRKIVFETMDDGRGSRKSSSNDGRFRLNGKWGDDELVFDYDYDSDYDDDDEDDDYLRADEDIELLMREMMTLSKSKSSSSPSSGTIDMLNDNETKQAPRAKYVTRIDASVEATWEAVFD